MAKLDPRMDSFISLLLDVSGRARPVDITGVSADEAAALLHEFATAHPEKGLSFDGQVLAPGGAASMSAPPAVAVTEAVPVMEAAPAAQDAFRAPAEPSAPAVPAVAAPQAPEWAPAPAPAPEPDFGPTPEFVQGPGGPEPVAAPGISDYSQPAPPSHEQFMPPPSIGPQPAAPVPAAYEPAPQAPLAGELPSWVFEDTPAPPAANEYSEPPAHEAGFGSAPTPSAAPAPAPASTPPLPTPGADYGVPQAPSPGGFYGVTDAAPPEYAAGRVADYAPAGDFVPQPQGPSATLDYVMATPAGPDPVPTRVSPLWWLAVLFFSFPGAFVAWFVNRGRVGAKAFLWVGIALVILLLISVAALVLLGGALSSLAGAR